MRHTHRFRIGEGAAADRLVGLCDRAGWMLALAVIERADWAAGQLHLHAPLFDADEVVSVQFGAERLKREW